MIRMRISSLAVPDQVPLRQNLQAIPNRHPLTSGIYRQGLLGSGKVRDRLRANLRTWSEAGDHGDADWAVRLARIHPFGLYSPWYLAQKQSGSGAACTTADESNCKASTSTCPHTRTLSDIHQSVQQRPSVCPH